MPPDPRLRRLFALAAALLGATAAQSGGAVVLAEDELADSSTDLGLVGRSFGLLLTGDVLRPPYGAADLDPTAIGLFDARLYFGHRRPSFKLVAHEQLTLSVRAHALPTLLPLGRGPSPPRWLPLTFSDSQPTLALRSDLDWAYAEASFGPATVTLGRQPVTFGRAALFPTADRIATFALTEIDTAYKPGADAVRVDVTLGERAAVTLVAAVGELESEQHDAEVSLRGSSLVARLRQGWGGGEAGVIGGLVRCDAVLGVDLVLDLGALDLYGELTATRLTPGSAESPAVSDRRVPVIAATVGATLRPAGSLTLKPEIGFDGFGSFAPVDYFRVAVSERVTIGEQQRLGKLHAGLALDWEVGALTHVFAAPLVNLHDPSALGALGVRHDLAQDVDLVAGAFVPMGYRPDMTRLEARSEYGTYPYLFYTELKAAL